MIHCYNKYKLHQFFDYQIYGFPREEQAPPLRSPFIFTVSVSVSLLPSEKVAAKPTDEAFLYAPQAPKFCRKANLHSPKGRFTLQSNASFAVGILHCGNAALPYPPNNSFISSLNARYCSGVAGPVVKETAPKCFSISASTFSLPQSFSRVLRALWSLSPSPKTF